MTLLQRLGEPPSGQILYSSLKLANADLSQVRGKEYGMQCAHQKNMLDLYNIYIHRHIIYNYHLYCIIISKILYDSCMYVLCYIELPYTDQHARS